jgi:hypothetical protein
MSKNKTVWIPYALLALKVANREPTASGMTDVLRGPSLFFVPSW